MNAVAYRSSNAISRQARQTIDGHTIKQPKYAIAGRKPKLPVGHTRNTGNARSIHSKKTRELSRFLPTEAAKPERDDEFASLCATALDCTKAERRRRRVRKTPGPAAD
jgi:hypothetical protein